MMFKSKYILYTLLATGIMSSCKKQLDLVPTDVFSEVNAFRTIADAQLGANEAFSRYGAYANTMYISALLSDEAKLGVDNAGQGALTYRYQYSADATTGGDVTSAYGSYYFMIDQVNRVLANLPKVIAAPSEEPRRNILKGQMLALRALGHFGVMQAYSKNYNPSDPKGVPIMLQYDANAKPSRNSMGEVMTQIEADLNSAKALLPVETTSSFSDTIMNQINITAFQSRIALYKGDYQKAIDYASTVISSGIKPLVTGTAFTGIWTDANTSESLFRIRYSTDATIGSLWTTTGNVIYIAPSSKLVAAYGTGDIRKAAFIGTNSGGNNYVNKFYTSSKGGRVLDIKACRTAEMYLIRAEAYAKIASPNLALGSADLNALRAKRITGYMNQAFSSPSDLTNAVLDERFKELCFEGFRFFDLKRNNLPVQRNADDANAAWQNLAPDNYRFVLPIPQYELLANPNMVQNDQY